MDGFSDAFNNVENNENGNGNANANGEGEADPAAEFLAREQDTLGGLDDDFKPFPVSNGPSSSELVIEEDNKGFTSGDNELDSGFEMINHNHSFVDASLSTDNIGNNINGNGFDMRDEPVDSSSPTPSQHIIREEPEKIKRWREEQAKRLANKDDEEEDKKQEMKEAAKKELEEWYKNHEEQVAKTRKTNRSAEKELVADTEPMEPGTEWERIAKLCDFNPKGSKHQKDISRMRSIILKVKQNQPQPNQFVSQHPPPNNHLNNGQ